MRVPSLPSLLAAALLPLVSATIFITNPTATSTLAAGKSLSITWLADPDSTAPKAAAFGAVSIGLYTGSSTQQTLLQTLGNVTDPTKSLKLAVKFDPAVGPDSAFYFVRVQSLAAKDSAGAPLQAFSARFTLTKMNGTFTSAENAQNSGIAPVDGTTTGSALSAIQTAGASSSITLSGNSNSATTVAKNGSASAAVSAATTAAGGNVKGVAALVAAVVLGVMVL
ncbi:hypothetical protein RQP46_005367 [Phenoliferia psychrophenolica]